MQARLMKDVEWTQDLNSLTVKVPIKRTTLKKIDVMFADQVIKITCTEKNIVKIFDLFLDIDNISKKNSIKYSNDVISTFQPP
jgi:hypothetical protein